jgi:hypothetical protein
MLALKAFSLCPWRLGGKYPPVNERNGSIAAAARSQPVRVGAGVVQ